MSIDILATMRQESARTGRSERKLSDGTVVRVQRRIGKHVDRYSWFRIDPGQEPKDITSETASLLLQEYTS